MGSVLFSILVYDMDDKIASMLRKFADDTKKGRSLNLLEVSKVLQWDLDKLDRWVESNDVTFNKGKCWVTYNSTGLRKSGWKVA